MEPRHGQQPLPSTALTQPAAPVTSAAQPGVSRSLILRRTLRLMLRRALYAVTVVARPLRRYAAFLAIIVVLLGVIGWLSLQLWSPATPTQRDTRVALIPPPQAVENYIKGRQNFNAELMWSAMSPDLQARNLQSGQSKESLQAQVDRERSLGVRFTSYDYIGGVDMDDGGKMFFYAAQFQVGTENVKMPATFRVNRDGEVQVIYAIEPMQLLQTSQQ